MIKSPAGKGSNKVPLQYKVNILKPQTFYLVRIAAFNSAGVGNYSTTKFFTEGGKRSSILLFIWFLQNGASKILITYTCIIIILYNFAILETFGCMKYFFTFRSIGHMEENYGCHGHSQHDECGNQLEWTKKWTRSSLSNPYLVLLLRSRRVVYHWSRRRNNVMEGNWFSSFYKSVLSNAGYV